jgi:hypothetical protein
MSTKPSDNAVHAAIRKSRTGRVHLSRNVGNVQWPSRCERSWMIGRVGRFEFWSRKRTVLCLAILYVSLFAKKPYIFHSSLNNCVSTCFAGFLCKPMNISCVHLIRCVGLICLRMGRHYRWFEWIFLIWIDLIRCERKCHGGMVARS